MGILSRFKDIMSSNINALLDGLEDPSKMIDELLRNLNDDIAKVKAETAGVMAEETRARRMFEEADKEAKEFENYAIKAASSGNDHDAKIFLKRKMQAEESRATYETNLNVASENTLKMRELYNKLESQISELNSRRDAIKSKVTMAKTQEKFNKINSKVDGVKGSMSAFDRMEEKANKMFDTATAMEELNNSGKANDADDLKSKYDKTETDMDDELAKLKEKHNL